MVLLFTNPGQMSLELVPGISAVLHSLGECDIDRIPLLPHLVSAGVQTTFYLVTHVL